jgi:hypothetical protein
MQVEIGDRKYRLWFRYGHLFSSHPKHQGVIVNVVTCTIVDGVVVKPHPARVIAEGVSECSPTDKFSKVKGRKIALARALDAAKLSREDRAKVWEQYAKTHRRALGDHFIPPTAGPVVIDRLAEEAIEEREAGQTTPLRQVITQKRLDQVVIRQVPG